MQTTIVIRHKRENLRKCSLVGLEKRKDFLFLPYPETKLPDLSNYLMLTLDAPPLSEKDQELGLILIDATWRYAEKMIQTIQFPQNIVRRSLPDHYVTAYPRKQEDCPNPERGLASIEALYIAFKIMGKECDYLLENYYWKDLFLQKNFS